MYARGLKCFYEGRSSVLANERSSRLAFSLTNDISCITAFIREDRRIHIKDL